MSACFDTSAAMLIEAASPSRRFAGHFVDPIFTTAHQRDLRALADQSQGAGAADAAACAGYDCDFIF